MTNNTHTPLSSKWSLEQSDEQKAVKNKKEKKMQQQNKELIIFEKLLKIKSESAR